MRLLDDLGAPGERGLDPERAARTFARMAEYPDYAVYVAEEEGAVVGTFALLVMDNLGHGGAPEGVVENVVVEASRRGQGIGAAMMRFAMDRCADAGCYKMVLSSNLKREAAHRFYDRLDFQRHGISFSVEPRGGAAT